MGRVPWGPAERSKGRMLSSHACSVLDIMKNSSDTRSVSEHHSTLWDCVGKQKTKTRETPTLLPRMVPLNSLHGAGAMCSVICDLLAPFLAGALLLWAFTVGLQPCCTQDSLSSSGLELPSRGACSAFPSLHALVSGTLLLHASSFLLHPLQPLGHLFLPGKC